MKKVIIVHRLEGRPEGDWYPWLKRQLTGRADVEILKMPNPDIPTIEQWVGFLARNVKTPDKDTIFVGHSIGCQTILRYLETPPDIMKVSGAILVTPWVTLTKEAIEGQEEILKPWLDEPIAWNKIRQYSTRFVTIFSTDDPYVPLENSTIFKEKLDAKVIVVENQGHMTDEEGVIEAPDVLDSINKMVFQK